MREQIASRTALRVAIRRAEHQILDAPLVFDDPLSLRIIDPEAAAGIQPGRVSRVQRLSSSFRAYMAARSRFAEDELARAVAAGVRQYVVLGAGLDTFGYRNPHGEAGLQVFEVDHPATQAWKQERLTAAGIEIPHGTFLVPADFERHSLAETLAATRFRFDEPVYFSWLGVTPYLSDSAFRQTIRFVLGRPSPSAIVFDYAVPRESLNPVQKKAFDALAARVANLGEEFHLFLDPLQLGNWLRGSGFQEIEDLGYDDLNDRYFSSRQDGFRVKSRLARLVLARL